MLISNNDFQKPSLNMNPRDKRNRAGPPIISMLYMKKFEQGHLQEKETLYSNIGTVFISVLGIRTKETTKTAKMKIKTNKQRTCNIVAYTELNFTEFFEREMLIFSPFAEFAGSGRILLFLCRVISGVWIAVIFDEY